ncbi:MAG: hypothetical protein ACE5QV_07105 [Fidelibacterota bacterium]
MVTVYGLAIGETVYLREITELVSEYFRANLLTVRVRGGTWHAGWPSISKESIPLRITIG